MLKSFYSVLCSVVITMLCANGVLAGIALNANCDDLPLGSIGQFGQGNVGVTGFWASDYDALDPSVVVVDPAFPTNKSFRLTQGEGWLMGYSTISPISTGTEFLVSWRIYFIDMGDGLQIGSFYMKLDNNNSFPPSWPITGGIALYTDTVGQLYLRDSSAGAGIWRRLDKTAVLDLYTSKNAWVDFKLHITTWDDGTGKGKYDTYVNQGEGWKRVDAGCPFNSADLSNNINGVTFMPRSPTTGVPLVYIDDVVITSTPIDCQDKLLLNGASIYDFNEDCTVDYADLAIFANYWLYGN